MAKKIGKPGTEDGPCYAPCGHERCHGMRIIAGTLCVLCEQTIGFNAEYILSSARFVHLECFKVQREINREDEAARTMTVRQIRGAPLVIECWKCGYSRVIDDSCHVARCGSCHDSSYEYDVPAAPSAEWLAKVEALKKKGEV
jgi:hypothetical protein